MTLITLHTVGGILAPSLSVLLTSHACMQATSQFPQPTSPTLPALTHIHMQSSGCNTSVLFVTAFTEIEKAEQLYGHKSLAAYFVAFLQMAYNMPFPLVAYAQGTMAQNLHRLKLPVTVTLITDNIRGTFQEKYKEPTEAIIASTQFQSLLPQYARTNRLPEYSRAEYRCENTLEQEWPAARLPLQLPRTSTAQLLFQSSLAVLA